jgi:hypothetical protein
MRVLQINYDLSAPGRNYAQVAEYIKGLGAWLHALESTWFATTAKSPAQVRDEMLSIIDGNDRLLVLDVTGDPWAGFTSNEIGAWLSANLPANPLFAH